MLQLQDELATIEQSLQKKNEILIGNMMKNFGQTSQHLPYFKLPDIRKPYTIDDSLSLSREEKNTRIRKHKMIRWEAKYD